MTQLHKVTLYQDAAAAWKWHLQDTEDGCTLADSPVDVDYPTQTAAEKAAKRVFGDGVLYVVERELL